jgi:hypothetical protein
MCDTPGLTRVCKESYNQPVAVYDCCKQRGMSIVTLTDHNSIDGAEALPAVRWRLENLAKMDKKKKDDLVERLRKVLQL